MCGSENGGCEEGILAYFDGEETPTAWLVFGEVSVLEMA